MRSRRLGLDSCVPSVPWGSLYLLSFLPQVRKAECFKAISGRSLAALSGRPLRGGGRLLQGSRWAVRNQGSSSHFPTAECVYYNEILQSRQFSVPLPEREREVRHECSGIGAFQASGAWESLGGLVPVCPQGDRAACPRPVQRPPRWAGPGTRLACPCEPPRNHSDVSSPRGRRESSLRYCTGT